MGKTVQHVLVVGFALFALYFGAGNLIYPPAVGNVAGDQWLPALLGFCLTGVILPLLAVVAIYNTGGTMKALTQPMGAWFYKVFNTVLMVCIGMCLTIPRMAATTHEIGVTSFAPNMPQFVSVAVFFVICFYFAIDPANVIDRIGKWLTPVLVLILLVIIGKGIFTPIGEIADTGATGQFSSAVITAYQTGDVGTGILVAPIFLAAVLNYGYRNKAFKKVAWGGILIAMIALIVVYGGLLYIGATSSSLLPDTASSTELLSSIVGIALGDFGKYALALAIILACLTSAIGVMAIAAEFLNELTKNMLGYKSWVGVIAIIGTVIGSLGVNKIGEFTTPILLIIYPPIIVLVLLGVMDRFVPNAGAYRGAMTLTFFVSIIETTASYGYSIPGLTSFVYHLPFQSIGFAWVIPSIAGFVVGAIFHKLFKWNSPVKHTFEQAELKEGETL